MLTWNRKKPPFWCLEIFDCDAEGTVESLTEFWIFFCTDVLSVAAQGTLAHQSDMKHANIILESARRAGLAKLACRDEVEIHFLSYGALLPLLLAAV
jgi:hypothetical protein